MQCLLVQIRALAQMVGIVEGAGLVSVDRAATPDSAWSRMQCNAVGGGQAGHQPGNGFQTRSSGINGIRQEHTDIPVA